MDERTEAEVAVLQEFVSHPGWAILVRNTEERIKQFQAGCPFNLKNEADIHFHRGVLLTLMDLMALPDKLRQTTDTYTDSGDGE